MRIEFLAPLGRAIERMKSALFRPFDAGKWIVVGFSAWLAWLGQNGGGGGGGGRSGWSGDRDIDDFRSSARHAVDWVREALTEPLWLGLFVVVAFLLVVVVVAVLWVSSRGKFVFLDNVVRDGREIVEPWTRTSVLGNSLFFWRLGFSIAALAIAVPFLVGLWITVAAPFLDGSRPRILPAAGIGLTWVAFGILFAFVAHYLENFVVPIMYRHHLRANAAWGKFLGVFGADPLSFLLFAIFTLVLWIGIVLVILVLGCLTCCCAWLLLALPYIGTVLLLPVLYAYRAWGPEFLAQFGPDWTVWPAPEPPPAPAPVAEGTPA